MCAVALDSADHGPTSPDLSMSHSLRNLPPRPSILIIGCDPTLLAYKAAVLSTANLAVKAASPADTAALLHDGGHYEVVILSHTLEAADVVQISGLVRSKSGKTKILLISGPDTNRMQLDFSEFDATIHGLDGPAAFVHLVRSLASPLA